MIKSDEKHPKQTKSSNINIAIFIICTFYTVLD